MTFRPLGLAALPALMAMCALTSSAYAYSPPSPHGAPSSPPLTSTQTAGGGGDTEAGAGATPQAEADPLVSNGLGSPTCRGTPSGELSAANRRNCETSGFVAAPAPSGDYGIDVHIDTGVFGVSSGAALSLVQDLIVTPCWMGLVWAVHALVVMLEWCFTIDLLDSSAAIGLGSGLREAQATFTEPWLPIALSVASVLVLYHGLIRRRVADTLGEALVMGAMMVAGIWVISDPTGTVGALGRWANQASLGTLAVAARGAPSSPTRALGTSLQTVFAAAIEVPWCYLEFGDVSWCREPSRLDPRLRAAGLKIAAHELEAVNCHGFSQAVGACVAVHGAQAAVLEHSAQLLRDAQSNGAIFLALPANGPARNSINEQGSLLRTLCQTSEATNCSGPTASQAEFRTNNGTWPRLAGLLLIAGGLLGMLLLLGFMALRLLAAAIFSLVLLLLAPAMVLAPAFGEGGRTLFRRWATQLLGAVVSKLVFSFVLGALLAVLTVLSELDALGWWTQWLLMSAFWWGAYTHRHHALSVSALRSGAGAAGAPIPRRSLARRVGGALETPRIGIAAARWAKDKLSREATETQSRERTQAGHHLAGAAADKRVTRALHAEHQHAREHAGAAPEIQSRLSAGRARLERLDRERANALANGDRRRSITLGLRADRVRGEIKQEQEALSGAPRAVREGQQAHPRTGAPHARERRESWDRATTKSGHSGKVPNAGDSSVMRDAHEVAAGRKRQLGFDRP